MRNKEIREKILNLCDGGCFFCASRVMPENAMLSYTDQMLFLTARCEKCGLVNWYQIRADDAMKVAKVLSVTGGPRGSSY